MYQCIQKPDVWISPHCNTEHSNGNGKSNTPPELFASLFWKVPETANGSLEIRMNKCTKDGATVQIPTLVNKRQVNQGEFITHMPRKKPKVQQ